MISLEDGVTSLFTRRYFVSLGKGRVTTVIKRGFIQKSETKKNHKNIYMKTNSAKENTRYFNALECFSSPKISSEIFR